MRLHRLIPAAAAALLLAPAAGCTDAVAGFASVADATELTIGVKADQPGLGLRTQDGFEGFGVDVALYIAGRLGVPRENVDFTAVTSRERARVLVRDKVDLVVATYSITQLRKTVVTFAGPYYVAQQDILVRAGDASVQSVADLEG